MYLRGRGKDLSLSLKAYDTMVEATVEDGASIDLRLLGPRPTPPESKKRVEIRRDFANLDDVPDEICFGMDVSCEDTDMPLTPFPLFKKLLSQQEISIAIENLYPPPPTSIFFKKVLHRSPPQPPSSSPPLNSNTTFHHLHPNNFNSHTLDNLICVILSF
ncbi:hypothetical protein L1887_08991 [Cichorium endivia]|nr:hypothetical protein L1887_08991 [Cichorium endivia]